MLQAELDEVPPSISVTIKPRAIASAKTAVTTETRATVIMTTASKPRAKMLYSTVELAVIKTHGILALTNVYVAQQQQQDCSISKM